MTFYLFFRYVIGGKWTAKCDNTKRRKLHQQHGLVLLLYYLHKYTVVS